MTDLSRRLPVTGNIFRTPRTAEGDMANLHEVFLNSWLQRSMLTGTTPPLRPQDRGRCLLMHLAFLYVLVEAWRAPALRSAVQLIGRLVPRHRVKSTLRRAERSGDISRLRAIRNHMFHRSREVGDSRTTLKVDSKMYDEIYEAFSTMFLAAMAVNKRRYRERLLLLLRERMTQPRQAGY